ncbi:amidoligase family protein [Paenibacillus hodogayensis]|uniref:Amidoligase family protein n=1 Tax=Paenibacillus hodogayensis TaxID=279208 RepID=A0ABV5W9V5_9BACL
MHEGLSDLTFGVEVEFSGITCERAAQVLVEVFDTTFARFGGWDNEEFHIPDPQDRIWKVEKDGSVDAVRKEGKTVVLATDNYKCELVSAVHCIALHHQASAEFLATDAFFIPKNTTKTMRIT